MKLQLKLESSGQVSFGMPVSRKLSDNTQPKFERQVWVGRVDLRVILTP